MLREITTIRKSGTLAVAIAAALASGQAQSQGIMEEIVVSAQKRDQSVQDIGAAISVLSADDLRDLGITSASEVTEFVPNVQINTAGGVGNQIITIRGIGLNDYSLNNTPTAAVHVDEVYMSTNAMTGMAQFDLERVEVLKGPQGTLYGRNSTAGVINFITRKPDQEAGGYFLATGGNWSTLNLEGAYGAGITDTMSARVAFRSENRMDGFQRDRATGTDHGEQERFFARAQVQWDFETAMIRLNVHGGRDKSDEWLAQFEGTDDGTGAICRSSLVGQPNPDQCSVSGFGFLSGAYSDTDRDPHAGEYSFLPEIDDTSYGGSLRIEWDLGGVELTSLTAYEYYDYNHGEETDGMPNLGTADAPFVYLDRTVGYEATQISQELRLSSFDNERFNWVAGVFLADEQGEANELYVSDFLVDGVFITDRNIPYSYDQDGQVASVFAQGEFSVTDQLKLTLGGRYASEEKDWEGEFAFFLPPSSTVDEWNNTALRFGADYMASDNTLLYATVSSGFKAGGIPGAPPTSGAAPEPYDTEKVIAYEAGFKTTLASVNMQINASFFFYDYTDMQAIVKNDPADLAETLDNFGDAEVTGAEIDVNWFPTENTLVRLGIGLLDTEVTKSDGEFLDAFGQPADITGNQLPHAPEWSGNALFRHNFPLTNGMEIGVQADAQFRDSYYLNIVNDESFAQNSSVFIAGARLDLAGADDNWNIALWGRNLTDEEVRQYGVYSLDNRDHIIFWNMPRSYGVTVQYNF